jgi:hypothetical protein
VTASVVGGAASSSLPAQAAAPADRASANSNLPR